jgi:hypothetical protein
LGGAGSPEGHIVVNGTLLALSIAAVALLAFVGGYLIGHWQADRDRGRDQSRYR